MRKYFNILSLVLALSAFLSACGVKKNATAEVNAAKATLPATTEQAETAMDKSLEQRAADGEFAWLDRIKLGDSDTSKMVKCSGHYSLDKQYDSCGEILDRKLVEADSLVLTQDGYYYKYKETQLVDFGRYSVRKGVYKICLAFKYSEEDKKQYPELTREQVEYDIRGFGDMVFDMYSYINTHKAYWIRCFGDGRESKKHAKQFQHLCFLHDMSNPECFSFFEQKESTYWTINY